jgi:hypothetical protein
MNPACLHALGRGVGLALNVHPPIAAISRPVSPDAMDR